MTVISSYTKGLVRATRSPRMIILIYAINFFLALLIAIPFGKTLSQVSGNSMNWQVFLKDFDFSIFINILKDAGKAVGMIQQQMIWAGFIYLIINIFLTGGILRIIKNDHFTVSTFFGGSGQSFFRFLGLDVLILLLQMIFAALIFTGIGSIISKATPSVESEQSLYLIAVVGLLIYFLIFLFLMMVSDFGKSYLELRESFNLFKGFGKGWAYTMRHFFKSYTLYLLLIIVPIALAILYIFLDDVIKTRTGKGIMIMFFIQQAYIISRVWVKIWIHSSQYKMFADDIVKDEAKIAARKKAKEIIDPTIAEKVPIAPEVIVPEVVTVPIAT